MLARFHLARAKAQDGDRPGAVKALKALQADMPIEDPRRESLAQAITEAEGPAPGAVAAVAVIVVLGRVVLRPLFRSVARTRSEERVDAWIERRLGPPLELGAHGAGGSSAGSKYEPPR